MRALRSPLAKTILSTTTVLAAVIGVTLTGTSAQAATPSLPPANGQFDYQIGGAYTPASSVSIVDRDRSSSPVVGKYNICYVNAFQTQPEEKSFWTGSHSDLLLKNSDGSYVEDPDWKGEYLLDTSTAAKRTSIAGIVDGWIDGCQSKGYQAVEPDNLDSWTRSKGKLTKANAIAYATLLATHAHADGLAIAQKNTTELGSAGKNTVKFDFAIAEECQFNTECDAYTDVYGNNVIEIEYTDNRRSAYTNACAAQGKTISVILRDRDVVPSSDPAYRYEYC
ncbi:hypothetical protein GCM10025867_18440 [Frondihabitans sucicola]|uniref:Glycoside-hydrolase family GH114 TIM-barrel domain-containing protein n=1 Tax=Frondihabitans sucicola TaxID=1268041 RepID=A0ABN6XX91_9MICO|nr:endo alpha-1,4 polygalactosaminidase [Frondihabitans sucicola]BDZ49603.1 hypothetical protein GCM10025867_18440 [Frondihabitans sucicola]